LSGVADKCGAVTTALLRTGIAAAAKAVAGTAYSQSDVATITISGCTTAGTQSSGGPKDKLAFTMKPAGTATAAALAAGILTKSAQFGTAMETTIKPQLGTGIKVGTIGPSVVQQVNAGWARILGNVFMDFPAKVDVCGTSLKSAYKKAVASSITSVSGITLTVANVSTADIRGCAAGVSINTTAVTRKVLDYTVTIYSTAQASTILTKLVSKLGSCASVITTVVKDSASVQVSNVVAAKPALSYTASAT